MISDSEHSDAFTSVTNYFERTFVWLLGWFPNSVNFNEHMRAGVYVQTEEDLGVGRSTLDWLQVSHPGFEVGSVVLDAAVVL